MASPSEEEHDPLLGRVIDGRFTVQSVLGKGGMGVVYRAHQASLERSVALKVMMGLDSEREAEFQRRFFLEAATVAKLKHPNTITVFDYGSTDVDGRRVFFIAMELLEGLPLSKVVSGHKALAPLRAVHIGMQVCRSLREAHHAGVVHRDLKPGNVMIVKQDDADDVDGDFVKVLDFGLAKVTPAPGRAGHDGARPIEGMTKAGTFMGSPRYVAPEQVEGRAVDARADIYSFGCMMYRLLAGHVPFDGKTPVEIMLKQVNEPAPPLEEHLASRVLRDLVMQCLEKDPDARPRSMDEVLVRLKLARAELGGVASGVFVVSDERLSIPEGIAVSEPPRTMPEAQPQAPQASAPPSSAAPALPAAPMLPAPGEWALGSLERPLQVDDSTRPTKVFGHLTASARPARRPWVAMTAGALLGVSCLAVALAWRTGALAPVEARLRAWFAPAPAVIEPEPDVPAGPLAKAARIRVTTTPPGADVLEDKDGLPRLLGVTPLTIEWDVQAQPAPRKLVLRKDGFVPARARVAPPPAPAGDATTPVALEVEATLRPELKR